MYDKYDKYALVPVTIQSSTANATFGTAEDDRIVAVNINGLPFTNNVYSTNSKTNLGNAVTNVVKFVQSTAVSVNGGTRLTFTKNQELVNLNIFYQRINSSGTSYNIATTSTFPHVIFTFNIYGINKTDRVDDLNSSRLF